MTPIREQAKAIAVSTMLVHTLLRSGKVPTGTIVEECTDIIVELLQKYQDELLEEQRRAATALSEALGRK